MKLEVYLNFSGACEEAFRFYETHLGGRILSIQRHGEIPNPAIPGEWKDKVLHARIEIGGTEVMGADIPNAEPMRSAYVSLTVDSDAEAERVYGVLGAGGQIFMPMAETFFASRFAMLRDRFGISWMIVNMRPRA